MKKTTMIVLLTLIAIVAIAAWAVYQESLGHHEDARRAVEDGGGTVGTVALIAVFWVLFVEPRE